MTSASASADNPPRRSSRRRPATKKSTIFLFPASNKTGRVTRSSGRLPANGGDSHDRTDANRSRDSLPKRSASKNHLKRANPNVEDSQPLRKSRRKAEASVARGDQNLSSDQVTYPSARLGEDIMKNHIKPTKGTNSYGDDAVTTSDSSSTGVAQQTFNSTHPRWESLEYSILVQVFDFLHDPSGRIQTNRFLLEAATTCKAFAEPALTALHKSPILCGVSMLQKLADHVSDNSSHNWCNYRQKVEILIADVDVVAHGAARGPLGNLVRSCPRLTHIKLHHWKDGEPYRQLDEPLRWTYPTELIQALGVKADQDSATRLKSWWWSKRMIEPKEIPSIRDVHLRPSFLGLQEIGFVNFQLPSMRSRREDPVANLKDEACIKEIADSLSVLPKLRHLVLESCTVVDGRLLSLLPTTIQHLELINCWEVTAEELSAYLSSHGRHLEQLTLKHNQSLSLSFLPNLSRDCPNLRALRMDFRYFRLHEFYHDCQPYYDFLLQEDEVPTWPRTLEVLELEQLREWTLPAAKNFFQSIADNAASLVNLRCLVIKATLDIPWRERGAFRDHWVGKLKKLFALKTATSASPAASSATPQRRGQKTRRQSRRGVVTPTRRSTRTPGVPGNNTLSRRNGASRGLRIQTRPGTYRDPDTDVDDLTSESESVQSSMSEDTVTSPPAVQGRCEVVDIKIDNQKPTETQFGMADFIDGDDEGDELNDFDNQEWVSDASEDDGYAW